jgi:hypothetical protein
MQEQIWRAWDLSGSAIWAGAWRRNLAKAGHDVRAFDLSDSALAKAEERGCTRAGSAAEAMADAEAVVSMLPAGRHVREVYESSVFGRRPGRRDPDRLSRPSTSRPRASVTGLAREQG